VEESPTESPSDFPADLAEPADDTSVSLAEDRDPSPDEAKASEVTRSGKTASAETPNRDPSETDVRVVIDESQRVPVEPSASSDPSRTVSTTPTTSTTNPASSTNPTSSTGANPESPGAASPTSTTPGESPSMVAEVARLDARSAADHFSDDALVTLLVARARNSLVSADGGLGEGSDRSPGEAELNAARRLAALTVARALPSADDEALGVALTALRQGADTEKLLAAACFLERGMPEAAREILSTVEILSMTEKEEAAPQAIDTAATTSDFRLENVSFATAIEGTGKFTPATRSSYRPGDTILVYGEFRGARALAEETEPGKLRYRQAFAGRLRLVSPEGNEVESVEFLPEPKGSHLSRSEDENVNFWARYRVPVGIEPGEYHLEVEARDTLARETTTVEISFTVEP
jgi:hypothetical protein